VSNARASPRADALEESLVGLHGGARSRPARGRLVRGPQRADARDEAREHDDDEGEHHVVDRLAEPYGENLELVALRDLGG
jgi:hypothetical protein